jgi:hypothetical protein
MFCEDGHSAQLLQIKTTSDTWLENVDNVKYWWKYLINPCAFISGTFGYYKSWISLSVKFRSISLHFNNFRRHQFINLSIKGF